MSSLEGTAMNNLFIIPEPAIRDRLRHNVLPSDKERNAIIESIAVAERLLSESEAESALSISAARNIEEDLLRRYISDYSSLTAPIRRLPADILETIFLDPEIHDFVKIGWVTPSSVVDEHNPLLIASVSHHWRDVAVHTARLWSSFYLNGCRGEYTLRSLRLCLDRSKDAALDFTLDLSSLVHPNSAILDEIMKHAERWVHFSLVAPPNPRHLRLFAPVRGRLHRLEAIAFKVTAFQTPSQTDVDVAEWDAFQDAPRLTALELETFRVGPLLPLPFHQIQTVSFTRSASGHCSELFAMFPSAREMTFVSTGPTDFDVPNSAPEALPAVRRIVLGDALAVREDRMDIFDRLNTPSLEELYVVDCYNWNLRAIPFIARSGCTLQTLAIHNTRVPGRELLALLRELPTLGMLVLTNLPPSALTDLVIQTLIPLSRSPTTDAVLPALTRLVLAGDYLFKTHLLLQMLEARADSLVVIDISLPSKEFGGAELERFAALRPAESSCLQCLDEQGGPVRIQSGGAARPGWLPTVLPLPKARRTLSRRMAR